jgi:macrolide transport system ATP-binding/permease protein
MTTIMQDLHYALRQLRKTPAFTVTVMLTLALGIGANAAIFTLVNAVLLKNLPVADPQTLIRLGDNNDCCVGNATKADGDYGFFSTDTYEQLKKGLPEFEDLAAMQAGFGYRPVTVRRDGVDTVARSVMGEFVSGNYFRTLGLTAHAGRLLADSDDRQGAPITGVMSYETWQHSHNGDHSIVGSTFWINTKAVTIVGIAPKGFFGDRLLSTPPDYYLPIESMPIVANVSYVHDPNTSWLYMIGRIKPGVAMAPLQEKANALLRQIYATRFTQSPHDRELLAKTHVTLTPGGAGIQAMQEEYASHLHLLMWISGLVLLIACANIANLLLVRGMSRRAEMSVRAALGAMRGRLIRQLLTESILLAVLGGIMGLIVAFVGTRMLLTMAFPGAQGVPIHANPSPAVIGFAFGLSLLTGILFGVAPAWIAAQTNPADVLRSGTRTTVTGASLLQRSLVVLQAALSLVLLVGAGLFAQSLNKLQSKDLKLDVTNRYILHINPQAAGYLQTQLEPLYRTMEQLFHTLPGVTQVGIASYTPMEDNNSGTGIWIEGFTEPNHGSSVVKANADYFDSVGTRVTMGRGIGVQDTSTAPPIAVVNQEFVKLFLKNRNPIGAHFGTNGPRSSGDYEIVGVVEDTVYQSVKWAHHQMYFLPMMQRSPSDKSPIETDGQLYAGAIVIATDRPVSNMEALARKTLASINPNLTVVKFQTFTDQISDLFSEDRMLARLTMLFGVLALLLATIGLYGVTAYNVARRTSEIGIRMALGAERSSVIAMVMRGAILQAGLGLAIGIPVALLCVRFVKTQLYEITKVNPAVMASAIATLAVAACIAGLIPAKRAASTDPAKALRTE